MSSRSKFIVSKKCFLACFSTGLLAICFSELTSLPLAAMVTPPVHERTAVEKHYNCEYQEWQLEMNKFGALAKVRYFRPYLKPNYRCAEFGASSGNILAAMPCASKVGIEINPCARKFGEENLNLTYVERASQLKSNSLDLVYTTAVLEHVECPICEVREIFRVLRSGGVFIAQVPGMAPSSMKFTPGTIDNELQLFGALEMGNILVGAGFDVDPTECTTEITQWPSNYEKVFDELGEEGFHTASLRWGETHDRLATTTCVGLKR